MLSFGYFIRTLALWISMHIKWFIASEIMLVFVEGYLNESDLYFFDLD